MRTRREAAVPARPLLKKLIAAAAAALLGMAVVAVAFAAGNERVMSKTVTEEGVTLYLKGGGGDLPESVRIGSTLIDGSMVKGGEDFPIVTWLVVDNSLSISSADRTRTGQLLTDLVANKKAGESFVLCTFDDKLEVLTGPTGDYTVLKAAIDGIRYTNHSAYLLDAVGEIVDSAAGGDGTEYVRVVVVCDSIELNPNGLTRDEFNRKLEQNTLPVYMIGCRTSSHTQDLNDIYSVSRQTEARSWTLSDAPNTLEIASVMSGEEIPVRLVIGIPEELKDGSAKGIQLTFAGGEVVTLQAVMPFGELPPTPDTGTDPAPQETEPQETQGQTQPTEPEGPTEPVGPEDTAQPPESTAPAGPLEPEDTSAAPGDDAAPEDGDENPDSTGEEDGENGEDGENDDEEDGEEEMEDKSSFFEDLTALFDGEGLTYLLIGVGALALIAAVTAAVLLIRKSSKDRIVTVSDYGMPESETEQFAPAEYAAGSGTIPLGEGDRNLTLYLTDRVNPGRHFEVPLRGRVTVGRLGTNQVVLDYERSVSGRHCEIYSGGGAVMIRDLNSSNGTYIDGIRVASESELANGSVIRLGRLEFEVRFQ